ncbi:hypothetical protein H0A35_04745 [Bacillus licheniformis]|uniref:hypothetical protein n=1 Tax=Bacillus licheniformis TaxID=1402 RepID=UPI0011AAF452|nr:hypothetical protein [Bacillus licheniformis]MBA1160323.1 hypothetical protein [Bacillus licheniformis]TWN41161.1 hypothetical protein CHCC14525_2482 [Bacillus licheniformis]
MIQGKKYIKTIERFVDSVDKKFRLGVKVTDEIKDIIGNIGFPSLEEGQAMFPPIVGRFTRFNMEGKEIVRRDLPKETIYISMYSTRKEFRGRNQTEDVTDFVDIPRKVFKKEIIPGTGFEIVLEKKDDDLYLLINESFDKEEDKEKATIGANIILELVGYCEILNENLEAHYQSQQLKRYNWVFLESKGLPWEERKKRFEQIIETTKKSKQMVLWERFETISDYEPEFEAIGQNGFSGYVVFGFENKGLYVFENAKLGNATYIVKGDWESVSKMSKTEIIKNKLHEFRLIHRNDWKGKIKEVIS